jgi:hypothetical protein
VGFFKNELRYDITHDIAMSDITPTFKSVF